MKRREALVFLLDHLNDCTNPAGTTSSAGVHDSDGLGIPLTPLMARHPSVVELTRCLGVLERMAPAHHLHLSVYFGSGWMVRWVPKKTGNGQTMSRVEGDRRVPVLEPVRVRAIPEWLRRVPVDRETGEPRTVARGVDFLSGVFRGEVFIPSELLEAA